ncbi:hypothetical protein CANINC_004501 [Pichia inconspicua]|uniref:Uncharacterized protein n=1 Tax=Pichia inconspicua TaxID=52247 RepID=A0A4T0WWZ9_9ASCO|nr:hypothetical protein CANINC_004501 [[Candida] inconspicua]
MAPIGSRESLVPSDMQLVIAPQQTNYDFEELKRTYGIQNNILAKQNEELRIKLSDLERQLFTTQKELLQLRNERVYLREKLQSDSRRFNNVIVNSFETMMNEYREFMSDVKVDIEEKKVSPELKRKVVVDKEIVKAEVQNFDQYWKQINNNLQRRKSLIRQPISEMEKGSDDLDTLVENEDEMIDSDKELVKKTVEFEEKPQVEQIAPPYEDVDSSFVPTKHKTVEMEKVEKNPLEDVPLLTMEGEKLVEDEKFNENAEVGRTASDDVVEKFSGDTGVDNDNNNDELFDYNYQSPVSSVHASPVKDKVNVNTIDETKQIKQRTRKPKVSRELKNLDPEKTRRWTGVDPFEDDFESTSDRRKSRRRSLVVNYQLPIIKPKNKRGREKMTIFIDDSDSDKENRVSKRVNNKKGTVLKNISNIQKRNETNGKSIFDLENTDMFSSYDKSRSRRAELENQYDMLL